MSFSSSPRRSLKFLALAAILPLLAVGLELVFPALIGQIGPGLLFIGAIVLAAWHGGLEAGCAASLWSALWSAFSIFRLASTPQHTPFNLGGPATCLFYVVMGCVFALIAARLRSAQRVLTSRTYRQTALARISGLALSHHGDDASLWQQAAEICAQTLEIEQVFAVSAAGIAQSPAPEFCAAVLAASAPVEISGFSDPASPSLSPSISSKTQQLPRAALGVSMGDGPQPLGVLVALCAAPRAWSSEERNFLTAIAGILAVAAARSKAEVARRGHEARYRTFVQQSGEPIWCFEFSPPIAQNLPAGEIIDLILQRGVLTECNDAFARASGRANALQMLGARLSDTMMPENERNSAYLGAFVAAGFQVNDLEWTQIGADGACRICLDNLVGMVEGGALLRVWGTRRDVTAQREADLALRASEERFRALFDAAPTAIAISRDNLLLYVNAASVRLLGCESARQMIGRPVSDFVAPTDREAMLARIARRQMGFDEPLTYEATSLRRDGEPRPLRLEVAPLSLPDGPATLAFAFDLSEEKAAQAQREALLGRERRAAERAARLQEITASLARTLGFEEVAQIIVRQGVEALGATSGAFSVPRAEKSGEPNSYLLMVASVGYSDEVLRDYRRLPLDNTLPAARAVLEGRPSWLATQQEAIAEHPIFAQILPSIGVEALCALPLQVDGRVLGALSLSFDKPQDFDPETRAFMLTLAGQCAQALDRVRLFNQAREASRQQQESLALLNTLLDCAPIGLAFFDLTGRYVLLNSALAEIDGASVEEHLGREAAQIGLLGREIAPAIARVLESRAPSGEIEIVIDWSAENDAEDQNLARQRHCLASFYPVVTAHDELLGVGALVVDLSARVLAERERVQLLGELEMERARFEAILQQMPSAVIIGEAPSGRLVLGNPQVNEVFRHAYVAASSIENYVAYRGFRPDGSELEPHEWPLSRAITRGEIVQGEEITIERGDHSRGVIRLNAAPIRDGDGHIVAGVVVFDDVTERARADSAQRFVAEVGSQLVSILDETEIYRQLAQMCAFERADWCLIAVPGAQGLLSHVAVAHSGSDSSQINEREVQRFEAALAGETRFPWNIEAAMGGAQGQLSLDESPQKWRELGVSDGFVALLERLQVTSTIVTPLAARGRVLGVMIWISGASGRVFDDLDRQLAEELGRRAALGADNARLYRDAQAARDEAQEANRAKDEFLAVVSHELRTPLTPIMGWIELLRDLNDNEMRIQAYDVIERNARAQAQLINDILDVSRITTGKLRFEFKPVELCDWIERCVESLRPQAQEKNLTLQMRLDEVGIARIDVNRIQQVVWNLLQNAIKFTPANGLIRVELGRFNHNAVLKIQDSGQGIEAAFLPHVFDSFRQADSSSTRRNGGLGLGLAIVAHIVEGHGGSVRAQSEGAGKGATFVVELPLSMARNGAATASNDAPKGELEAPKFEAKPSSPRRLSGARVLVVDDEPDTREMLQTLLELHGARVCAVGSAQSALDIWPGFAPDILISDIGMPGTDGYMLRGALKESGFAAPSMALTAYTAENDVQKAREAGFDAHLPKPVDANRLLESVMALLGRS